METTNMDVSNAPTQKMKTVLLVDDDSKVLRALERHLEEEFSVYTAISAAEASIIVARQEVDLVLSDNLMSGELGTEFLEKVNAQYPHIKLLMLSGYIPEAAAKRLVSDHGVYRVLTKPCNATDVADAIRNALS